MRTAKLAQAVGKAVKGSLIGVADAVAARDMRIRTGSLALDYVLGGGLKVGAVTLFYGDQGSGKTTSALRICGLAQRLCRNCYRPAHADRWKYKLPSESARIERRIDAHKHLLEAGFEWGGGTQYRKLHPGADPILVELEHVGRNQPPLTVPVGGGHEAHGYCDCAQAKLSIASTGAAEFAVNSYEEVVCVWVDTEGAFDRDWARTLGVDTSRLVYVLGSVGEQAIDTVYTVLDSRDADVIVIDSLAQLVPSQEVTQSAEQQQQGLQARLINKAVRRWVAAANSQVSNTGRPVTQIWINQIREKIGMLYGDPTVKPGGKAQGFAAWAEVRFRSPKQTTLAAKVGKSKEDELKFGVEEMFVFACMKNRGAPTKGTEWHYRQLMRPSGGRPAGTVIQEELVLSVAMRFLAKTLSSGKAKYELCGRKFVSQKAILEALREDVAWQEEVATAALAAMLAADAGSLNELASSGEAEVA